MKQNERQTSSTGKLLGTLACIFALVLLAVILIASADIRGRRKVLDKYFSALEMTRYSSIEPLLAQSSRPDEILSTQEEQKEWLEKNLSWLTEQYGEKLKFSYRIRGSRNIETSGSSMDYALQMEIRASGDESQGNFSREFYLRKEKDGWKIVSGLF